MLTTCFLSIYFIFFVGDIIHSTIYIYTCSVYLFKLLLIIVLVKPEDTHVFCILLCFQWAHTHYIMTVKDIKHL